MVDDKYGAPGSDRPSDPTEGVRIIGAEEAAEAMERGDLASRRGGSEPKYGDRPKRPPVGPRPVLRFPLESAADPTMIEKPAVKSSGAIEFEPLTGTEAASGKRFDPMPDPRAIQTDPAPDPRFDPDPDPDSDPGLDGESEAAVDNDPSAPVDEDTAAASEASAPVEMPHWSDPPTGEVPKVVTGDDAGDDLDAWSSFAASSPRWRDSDRDWEADGAVHEMLGEDAEWRVGAMDDTRPTDDEIYSFEDLEPSPAPVATGVGLDDELESDLASEPVEREPIAIGSRARRATPKANPVADYASGGSGYAPPTGGAGRNIGTAAAVGVGLVASFLLACYLGPKFAVAYVVVALGLAALEFFNAVRRAGYQPATLLGLVATVCFPMAAYWKGFAGYPVVVALTVIAGLLWHLVGADGDARVVESVGVTLLGVMWIGGLGSFGALLLASPDGVGMFLAAVIATVCYDVAGLFIGRSAGTRPLSEASPNKTVEGLGGGMVVSLVVTVIVVGMVGIAPFDSAGAALVIALAAVIAAPFGDLCESLVKRDLGIKDMGSILPEHGGLLDRFDGFLFVLPAVFYAALFFELGPFKG